MVTATCRRCTFTITLPTGPLVARAMQQHVHARHTQQPSGHEFANEMIEEYITRSYAPRDVFGKRAHPVVRGVTDRNAPKRD